MTACLHAGILAYCTLKALLSTCLAFLLCSEDCSRECCLHDVYLNCSLMSVCFLTGTNLASSLVMAHHLPHSLADVLCEAPPLLAMLSPQDWTALSNCGRQLRHLIHSSVIAITVQEVRLAVDVLTGDWPQLASRYSQQHGMLS